MTATRASLLAFGLVAGCREPADLFLAIATDLDARELSAIRIEARRAGNTVVSEDRRISGMAGVPWELPGSYALISESSVPAPLEIEVTGYMGSLAILHRRAHASLAAGRVQLLRMGLSSVCKGMPCAIEHTCVEGACLEPAAPPESLPPYRPELVATLECDSGTAFLHTGDRQPLAFAATTGCAAGEYCQEGLCYRGARRGPGASFVFHKSFQTTTAPGLWQLVSGDLNRDGRPDLVARSSYARLTALVSRGDGSFTTVVSPTGNTVGVSSLAIGDIDGDGWLDLVGLAETFRAITVLGVGDGSFRAGRTLSISASVTWIDLGDFDGDGRLDLATFGSGDSFFHVYRGNGDGSFATDRAFSLGTVMSYRTTGDFDGDGRTDVVAAGAGGWVIGLGRADGSVGPFVLTRKPGSLLSASTADLDGDGHLDLMMISTPGAQLLLGRGDGTFADPLVQPLPEGAGELAARDLDLDGVADLIAVSVTREGQLTVLRGMGGGKYEVALGVAVGAAPGGLVVEDFDGDGRLDLAGAFGPEAIKVLLGGRVD